jgi:putative Mn2+ efflux pump MntP
VTLPISQTLMLAVGLGMDAMSVCMGVGVRWHGPGHKFRLAWNMGLFQFLMPIVGYFAGRQLARLLKTFGSYVGAALVFAIGVKMLYEALRSRPGAVAEETEHLVEKELHFKPADPTRGWSLMALSVATSIDALAAGVSLALKGAEIWQTSIMIGLVAGLMALTGVTIGERVGQVFGKYAEILGAAVLMGLGVSFLWL